MQMYVHSHHIFLLKTLLNHIIYIYIYIYILEIYLISHNDVNLTVFLSRCQNAKQGPFFGGDVMHSSAQFK